jgi:hypothetical protein
MFHLSPESVVAALLTINAAACALVPVEVKQKAPLLWAVLDALAFNVKHATNRLDSSKPWQQGLAAAVVGAVLSTVAFTATVPEQPAAPAPVVAPWPPVAAEAPIPLDCTMSDAAWDVTPCADATATTDTMH